MNHHNTRKRETDLQQATQLRHLGHLAEQLQAAYDQLQVRQQRHLCYLHTQEVLSVPTTLF